LSGNPISGIRYQDPDADETGDTVEKPVLGGTYTQWSKLRCGDDPECVEKDPLECVQDGQNGCTYTPPPGQPGAPRAVNEPTRPGDTIASVNGESVMTRKQFWSAIMKQKLAFHHMFANYAAKNHRDLVPAEKLQQYLNQQLIKRVIIFFDVDQNVRKFTN